MSKILNSNKDAYNSFKFVPFVPRYFHIKNESIQGFVQLMESVIDIYIVDNEIEVVSMQIDNILSASTGCLDMFNNECINNLKPQFDFQIIKQIASISESIKSVYEACVKYANEKQFYMTEEQHQQLEAALMFLDYTTHVVLTEDIFAEIHIAFNN